MRDTPETDDKFAGLAATDAGYWSAVDLCRKLERERNALRELSLQLAKELVSKCADPVHKHQVSELQDFDKYWKSRPTTMCTSDSANCQPSPRDRFAEANQPILPTAN
jgi:hypothetical protein